jgi:hypothetical protein
MLVKTALVLLLTLASQAAASHWVATWGASPAPQLPDEAQMRSEYLYSQAGHRSQSHPISTLISLL